MPAVFTNGMERFRTRTLTPDSLATSLVEDDGPKIALVPQSPQTEMEFQNASIGCHIRFFTLHRS